MRREKDKNIRKIWKSVLAAGASAIMLCSVFAGISNRLCLNTYASDKEIDVIELGTPQYAWWETDTTAKWSSVKKAHEYQLKLYIADDVDIEFDEEKGRWIVEQEADDELPEAVAVIRTGELTCDLSEYMNDLHSYYYIVRATPRISELAYVKNGGWKVSPLMDFRSKTTQGITDGKWRNYLEGSRYDTGEGSFLEDGWQLIRGNWYYLANGGYCQYGWQLIDGQKYYLGEDGRMATGWFMVQDEWYYANKDGQLQTGWIMPQPGKYYYLAEDGHMLHDTEVDGYQLESDGIRGEQHNK